MAKVNFTASLYESKEGYSLPLRLLKLTEALQDWRKFWAEIFIPRYLEQTQQNFETEGELSTRSGWPSLSPRYAAWKARHFPGRKILERTRRLRNSLSPSAIGSSDMYLEAGPTFLRLGTRVSHGRWHVERRPFLPPVLKKDWQPIIERFVREEVKGGR